IFLPTLIATITSTAVAITVATIFAKRSGRAVENPPIDDGGPFDAQGIPSEGDEDYQRLLFTPGPLGRIIAIGGALAFFAAVILRASASPNLIRFLTNEFPTYWLMPLLMFLIVCYGVARGVKIYEAVTEG